MLSCLRIARRVARVLTAVATAMGAALGTYCIQSCEPGELHLYQTTRRLLTLGESTEK